MNKDEDFFDEISKQTYEEIEKIIKEQYLCNMECKKCKFFVTEEEYAKHLIERNKIETYGKSLKGLYSTIKKVCLVNGADVINDPIRRPLQEKVKPYILSDILK